MFFNFLAERLVQVIIAHINSVFHDHITANNLECFTEIAPLVIKPLPY